MCYLFCGNKTSLDTPSSSFVSCQALLKSLRVPRVYNVRGVFSNSHLAFSILHLVFSSRIFYRTFHIFYLASQIFISHLVFFYLVSRIFYFATRIFYLACRIFISNLAWIFKHHPEFFPYLACLLPTSAHDSWTLTSCAAYPSHLRIIG